MCQSSNWRPWNEGGNISGVIAERDNALAELSDLKKRISH